MLWGADGFQLLSLLTLNTPGLPTQPSRHPLFPGTLHLLGEVGSPSLTFCQQAGISTLFLRAGHTFPPLLHQLQGAEEPLLKDLPINIQWMTKCQKGRFLLDPHPEGRGCAGSMGMVNSSLTRGDPAF